MINPAVGSAHLASRTVFPGGTHAVRVQKDDPVLDSGLVTPVGDGSTMGTGMAVMHVARSLGGPRLLLRLAITGGLMMAAWVMTALLAGTAAADTGVEFYPLSAEGGTTYTGAVVSSSTRPRPLSMASSTGVIANAVPKPSDLTGTVSNPIVPSLPAVEVPAPPVPTPPPAAATAPVKPQVAPARKSAKSHKHATKSSRAAAVHRPNAVPPPQAAPPAKPPVPADGPQAESGKTPLPPAPAAPVCPAAPGSAASPTYDNGGHGRALLGVLGDRARVVPPYATGVATASSMQAPGDVAGLLSSSPD
ncbi:hypothetical protein Aglo03_33150 [Actinokineospora globicatena]|uniref:Uncharacterized protein n=1 Tax=Actinokineospora globicatena TaxID=103729 RepID=A0A9W6QPZ6_9PSEU|nr:hypothetical protein Aglo03_33150 [Actinokineospora globicatena]